MKQIHRDAPGQPLRRLFLTGALCGIGAAAIAGQVALADVVDELAPANVPAPVLERIADGVYLHRSWATLADGGLLASNGLLVVGRNGALLVDTAWNAPDTERLITRVDRLTSGAPLLVYASQARQDRIGGLDAVHRRGVRSLGHETTVAAAMSLGLPLPATAWTGEAMSFEIGDRQIELFHPGSAQTRGNTVVYIEDVDLLFGGSMVQPAAANDLGVNAGPDAAGWPQALTAMTDRFGSPRIVVPGHGSPGSGALLAHSLGLAQVA